MNSIVLEICLDSVESAIAVQQGGAHRVELCLNLDDGGTTPESDLIRAVRKNIAIPLHVMIRHRAGNFCYSADELEAMKKQIATARDLGADGVVIGALKTDRSLDYGTVESLVRLARPMSVTFHRAFDEALEPQQVLEDLISLGIDRLLTSGCKPTAAEGIPMIADLMRIADGRIVIMPGSGISSVNIRTIAEKTGAREFHVRRGVETPDHVVDQKLVGEILRNV